ncbi:LpqB family beta-propeller domain-containing protein [Specibacter cremeus]|uniref:LpqB family beta-propeller domain-containing protein n=1 Tax=Specibacter cremeus TaxID=1629051 RepID=UPI000F77AC57|nr:LpqB family beta-propeller domain-containing protein [Specibacter cremeus]
MKPLRRTRPGRGRAAWAGVVVVVLLAMLVAAAGCATIPTHGPVGKSDPVAPRNNSVNINFQQVPPPPGATPREIIEGFINAGTGVADGFQVARQYLDPGLANTWKADARTLVYKNAFSIESSAGANSYQVKFEVQSEVDNAGILTAAAGNSVESIGFSLVKVDGQWRISRVPDGIMLKSPDFATLYSAYTLYFYDPTFQYGVPDVRWLAGRASTTVTGIVRAMLNGPAPYLKGAVASAFPDGISLVRDSVPVNDGVAQVDLTAQPLLGATVKQRQQMNAQLLVTLQKNLNTVTSVTLRADTRGVDLGNTGDEAPSLVIDNQVPATQVALRKNELVTFDGATASPIARMPSVAKLNPMGPAMSYDGKHFAFGSTDGSHVYAVTPGADPVEAVTGRNLTQPSFSPGGWAWTASGDGSGTVVAFDARKAGPDLPTAVLNVPWLAGRTVTALRISRDGSRALVVSSAGGTSTVQLAGILRSGDVPKELATPITLPSTGNPTLGVWVDGTSVAVMRPSTDEPVTIQVLDLKREPVALTPLKGVQWISAGSGDRNIRAQTSQDTYGLVGNAWGVLSKDLVQASFAG